MRFNLKTVLTAATVSASALALTVATAGAKTPILQGVEVEVPAKVADSVTEGAFWATLDADLTEAIEDRIVLSTDGMPDLEVKVKITKFELTPGEIGPRELNGSIYWTVAEQSAPAYYDEIKIDATEGFSVSQETTSPTAESYYDAMVMAFADSLVDLSQEYAVQFVAD